MRRPPDRTAPALWFVQPKPTDGGEMYKAELQLASTQEIAFDSAEKIKSSRSLS
jgi:hypothetical protein